MPAELLSRSDWIDVISDTFLYFRPSSDSKPTKPVKIKEEKNKGKKLTTMQEGRKKNLCTIPFLNPSYSLRQLDYQNHPDDCNCSGPQLQSDQSRNFQLSKRKLSKSKYPESQWPSTSNLTPSEAYGQLYSGPQGQKLKGQHDENWDNKSNYHGSLEMISTNYSMYNSNHNSNSFYSRTNTWQMDTLPNYQYGDQPYGDFDMFERGHPCSQAMAWYCQDNNYQYPMPATTLIHNSYSGVQSGFQNPPHGLTYNSFSDFGLVQGQMATPEECRVHSYPISQKESGYDFNGIFREIHDGPLPDDLIPVVDQERSPEVSEFSAMKRQKMDPQMKDKQQSFFNETGNQGAKSVKDQFIITHEWDAEMEGNFKFTWNESGSTSGCPEI